jgi:hypothetical protein
MIIYIIPVDEKVRKDMQVNEHKRLSNFTLRHKFDLTAVFHFIVTASLIMTRIHTLCKKNMSFTR